MPTMKRSAADVQESKMKARQQTALRCLARWGPYHVDADWSIGAHSTTVRVMQSLVARSFVCVNDESNYEITKNGRNAVIDLE